MSDLSDRAQFKASLQKRLDNLGPKERLECEKLLAEIRAIEAKANLDGTAELEKAKLASKKLELEILEAKTPSYKRSSFYVAITPVILALIGIIFTWSTGWFDTHKKELEADKKELVAEKKLLDFDVKQLEVRKAAEEARLNAIQGTNAALQKVVDELKGALTLAAMENIDMSNAVYVYSGSYKLHQGMLVLRQNLLASKAQMIEQQMKLTTNAVELAKLRSESMSIGQQIVTNENGLAEFKRMDDKMKQIQMLIQEIDVSKRLEWLRIGIEGMQSNKAAARSNFSLDVELRQQ